LTPRRCGNGVTESGETCDDSGTLSGDGCDATCQLEAAPPELDTCPGAPLALQANGTSFVASVTGSNAALADENQSCNDVIGSVATADAYYSVVAPVNGRLRARVFADYDATVSIADDCVVPEFPCNTTACQSDSTPPRCRDQCNLAELACDRDGDGYAAREVTVPVSAGAVYALVVDASGSSFSRQRGAYRVELELEPSRCGNGALDGGETCDDGNLLPADGCDASCQREPLLGEACNDVRVVTLADLGAGRFSAALSATSNFYKSDISGKLNDACGNVNSGDVFFSVVAPATGVLTAKVTSAEYDVTLYAHAGCKLTKDVLACADSTTDDGNEALALPVTQGETTTIVVDGERDEGAFALELTLTPPGCGDAVWSSSEACEDGNTLGGDGCSATCTLETRPGIATCPGAELAWTNTGVSGAALITVDTSALERRHAGSCGGSGREAILRWRAPRTGTLSASLPRPPRFDARLYLREGCDDAARELACGATTLTADVVANREYFLFVDGFDGGAGVATVELRVDP
jgi:cysteine-rich repeat protein